MLLHHSVTVFLTSLAYFMNYVTISHLILLVHDMTDIFLAFGRAFADTIYKKVPIFAFLFTLVAWFYYRLYFYPTRLIWIACYANPKIDEIYGLEVLGLMTHVLLVLHVYWFYLFLTYAKAILLKG